MVANILSYNDLNNMKINKRDNEFSITTKISSRLSAKEASTYLQALTS